MGTPNPRRTALSASATHAHHHLPPCTRSHQIGALALITATFLLTRAVDRLVSPLPPSFPSPALDADLFNRAGALTWPDRGYGSRLSLKIYVYEEDEIDGLRELMRGREGKISAESCVKGQWGTQLESPELKFSGPDKLARIEYFNHLRNAKFCLSPRGESSWTLRFYESFFVECVPVILSDQVELPFESVIDYTKVSIKWPSSRIGPQLLDFLESIPDEVIEEMIVQGRKMRCLWVYAQESEPCSAMMGIMWELQRKVKRFHQSAETFWFHNGSIVNRDLVEFQSWRTPLPLP